ncbi:SDR family NAD(P)-dependent oxidoreductase [Kribbella antibiotica]|uniref:Probable oxidoreductase n=1 Tax=Kribbella antibiotica TaxID=190195 RepID=A0A4R4ZW48_9ACTN|nr:SDR family NAD(P)-dependent oxidoreductase [Kribbella antibiotica]TDD63411.1 SDR family NAD(P)-dependent oxidoreductase [Kribbella antibiotica]
MSPFVLPFGPRATAAEVLAGVDLTGRRFIVTGGASGLGAATVRALAGAGAQVTIATRNPDDAAPLLAEFPRVDAAAIDLADLASVHAFTKGWNGPLDAVVANAGIMALPTLQKNSDGWELQLATNYLGHFALVNGLYPALKAAGRARVVLLSSGLQLQTGFDFDDPHFAERPYDPFLAYAQSKAADVLLAVGIGRKWGADGITANAANPGFIHTKLARHIPDATMQALGAMDADGNLITQDFFKTPDQGAATTTMLAASPLLDGVTGGYFENNQEAPVVDGGPEVQAGVAKWAVDPEAADRLWDYALPVVEGSFSQPS